MTSKKGNPPWTLDETLLALDLYLKRRPSIPGDTDDEVIALSKRLRMHAERMSWGGDERFRNPNGVSMKLGNLSRLDKTRSTVGLPHGAKREQEAWSVHDRDPGAWETIVAEISATFSRD